MARPLRLEFPGAVYHLTARGNARQAIYEDDIDRRTFLKRLGEEIHQQGWHCYAYCLMSNHYHLLIETPEANLVRGMRRLNGVYTQAFNRHHGRVGHLFQGRYKSIIVERESYLLELCRYIVLNPVRAKLVANAGEWPWSSYRATAGRTRAPDWLDTGWVLSQFAETRQQAEAAYRRFVAQGVQTPSPWENLRGQIWLGSEGFLEGMESLAQRHALQDVPLAQSRPTRPTQAQVLEQVCKIYDIEEAKVLDRSRQAAFQTAVYLLRRAANLSLKEVAAIAGVSPSRISHIQRYFERTQPHPRFEKLMRVYKIKN